MADPLMEIRAMTLLEFGCPPLPIANGSRIETNEPVVINSHDLLSVFMTQAFKCQDDAFNRTRKERQQEVELSYRTKLMSCDDSIETIYKLMSDYTRDYLATYLLLPYTVNDIHVLPIEHISPGMLSEIKHYHDALHQLYGLTILLPSDHTPHALFRGCLRVLRMNLLHS